MGAHPTTRYPRRENTQSNKVTMLAAEAEAGVPTPSADATMGDTVN